MNQFNVSIKYLQSDGKGKYMSNMFRRFLDAKGIIYHISCPHTPQRNEIAQKEHRHVVDTAISLLSDA